MGVYETGKHKASECSKTSHVEVSHLSSRDLVDGVFAHGGDTIPLLGLVSKVNIPVPSDRPWKPSDRCGGACRPKMRRRVQILAHCRVNIPACTCLTCIISLEVSPVQHHRLIIVGNLILIWTGHSLTLSLPG